LKCLFLHFSEVFTSSNEVMLKKYGKYPILKISKISYIFELLDIYPIYIADIYHANCYYMWIGASIRQKHSNVIFPKNSLFISEVCFREVFSDVDFTWFSLCIVMLSFSLFGVTHFSSVSVDQPNFFSSVSLVMFMLLYKFSSAFSFSCFSC